MFQSRNSTLNIKVQNTSTELNIAWFGHMMSKGLNWDQRCVFFSLALLWFVWQVLYLKPHNLKQKCHFLFELIGKFVLFAYISYFHIMDIIDIYQIMLDLRLWKRLNL